MMLCDVFCMMDLYVACGRDYLGKDLDTDGHQALHQQAVSFLFRIVTCSPSLFSVGFSPIMLMFHLYCSPNNSSNAPNYGDYSQQHCALEFLNWVMTTITASLTCMHLDDVVFA